MEIWKPPIKFFATVELVVRRGAKYLKYLAFITINTVHTIYGVSDNIMDY